MVHLVNTALLHEPRFSSHRRKNAWWFQFLGYQERSQQELGVGSSRSDGVLLLGTTLEPPKRLTSEAEGKSWLDGVVSVYAQCSGISLVVSGAGGAVWT